MRALSLTLVGFFIIVGIPGDMVNPVRCAMGWPFGERQVVLHRDSQAGHRVGDSVCSVPNMAESTMPIPTKCIHEALHAEYHVVMLIIMALV